MKYTVWYYFDIDIEVEADSKSEACKKAEKLLPDPHIHPIKFCRLIGLRDYDVVESKESDEE